MKLRFDLCTQPLLSLAKGGGLSRGTTTPSRKQEKQQQQKTKALQQW